MLAIWATMVLVVAAAATAMTLGWRRWSAHPVRAEVPCGEACGCYPRVQR